MGEPRFEPKHILSDIRTDIDGLHISFESLVGVFCHRQPHRCSMAPLACPSERQTVCRVTQESIPVPLKVIIYLTLGVYSQATVYLMFKCCLCHACEVTGGCIHGVAGSYEWQKPCEVSLWHLSCCTLVLSLYEWM